MMPNEISPMFAHVNEKRTACFSSSLYKRTYNIIYILYLMINEVVRAAATVVGPTALAITIGRNIVTLENRTERLDGRDRRGGCSISISMGATRAFPSYNVICV